MAELMQKLDSLGNAQPKTNGNPQQIVNVTYGHNGSGKMYSYYGQNKRAGDIVTPKVTNPKSGKTYKTLAVVRSTHNSNNMQPTEQYLGGNRQGTLGQKIGTPTNIKTLEKTDQKSLPGYYKGWGEDAQAVYDLKKEVRQRDDISEMQKLSLFNEITKLRR